VKGLSKLISNREHSCQQATFEEAVLEMSENTLTHLKQMREITDKLATIGAPILEEDQIVTLLGSLPQSYAPLVTAMEAQDNLTLGYVQQSLKRKINFRGERS